MSRKRVIYQSEALYVGPTGTDAATSTNNTQLSRVQSANYNFAVTRKDVNQYGDLAAIDRIVLEQPTVALDFAYYANTGENELNLGLSIGSDGTTAALSNILSGSADVKNYYILTTKEGVDANKVGWDAEGRRTIGIGNASLTSYEIQASVGDLPSVSVNVEGLNMNFVVGHSGQKPTVNEADGQILEGSFVLPSPVSGEGYSALRPGDIKVEINGGSIGVSEADLKVQSASMKVDIGRDVIQKLGSKFAFARVITFPVMVEMTVEAVVGDGVADNLATVLTTDASYDVSLLLNKPGQGAGTESSKRALKYTLKKAKIDSQDFSSSIGDNKTVSMKFSAQIGGPNDTAAGLFIDGPSA